MLLTIVPCVLLLVGKVCAIDLPAEAIGVSYVGDINNDLVLQAATGGTIMLKDGATETNLHAAIAAIATLQSDVATLRAENTELRRSLTSLSFTTALLLDHAGLNTTNTTSTPPAPTPGTCEYSEYSDYSLCSVLCDGGTQNRSRNVTVDIPGLSCNASVNLVDMRSCNTHGCPVDCVLGLPGNWSSCSASCGGGEQFRFRSILTHPQNGGAACPSLVDTTTCNTEQCLTNVCPGGVFTSASSLERLKECDFIAGDVVLSGIVDFIVLSDFMGNVTQINGTLRGFSALGMTSFGSMNLTHVTNNFEMTNMDGLTDFAGLEKVIVIGGDFVLDDCRSLQSLDELGVSSLGGALDVKSMTAITSLGLANLTQVGGDFSIADGPQKMGLLTTISFPLLETVSGFSISASEASGMIGLTSMSFPALSQTSSFSISASAHYGMRVLTSMSFPALTQTSSFSISASINTGGMHGLTSMSFPALTQTSSFSLSASAHQGMYRLTSMSFPALTQTSSFSISASAHDGMRFLTSMSFPALTQTSSFSISATGDGSMRDLTTLSFPALTQTSSFTISGGLASSFTSFSSLSFNNLTRVTDGELRLTLIQSLTSFSGFASLSRAHSLRLNNFPALTSVQGFNNLQTIDNSLQIQDTALVSINFLSSVTSIGTTTSITGNTRLALCQSLQTSLQAATAGTTTITGYGSLEVC